jgi:hypothetical protein
VTPGPRDFAPEQVVRSGVVEALSASGWANDGPGDIDESLIIPIAPMLGLGDNRALASVGQSVQCSELEMHEIPAQMVCADVVSLMSVLTICLTPRSSQCRI